MEEKENIGITISIVVQRDNKDSSFVEIKVEFRDEFLEKMELSDHTDCFTIMWRIKKNIRRVRMPVMTIAQLILSTAPEISDVCYVTTRGPIAESIIFGNFITLGTGPVPDKYTNQVVYIINYQLYIRHCTKLHKLFGDYIKFHYDR